MKRLFCTAFFVFVPGVLSSRADAQQAAATLTRQMADTAAASLAKIDSLYRARDTASLMDALRDWKGSYPPRVTLYRGLSALWSGDVPKAITILEQLPAIDSAFDSATVRASRSPLIEPEPILEALTSPGTTPPPEPEEIPSQIGFIALLFALFLVPKLLQRFRIPGAITSLLMGAGQRRSGCSLMTRRSIFFQRSELSRSFFSRDSRSTAPSCSETSSHSFCMQQSGVCLRL